MKSLKIIGFYDSDFVISGAKNKNINLLPNFDIITFLE